jgi:hypothetical protein
VIRGQIRSLLLGGFAAVVGMGLLFLVSRQPAAQPGPTLGEQLAQAVVWSVFIWSWLHAVIYLGIRWLNFPNRAIDYAKESVLPIYVIHHPIVLAVASFVVTWNLALWPKFAIIVVAVFALTLATYEFGVRRWRATRFVFGMSGRPVQTGQASPAGNLRLSAG